MGAFLFGKDAVLYHTVTALDGTNAGSVTWTEYDNVVDVAGDFDSVTVNTATRASAKNGWDSEENILKKGTITLQIPQKSTADATFDLIRDAWLNETLIALLPLNNTIATSGAQGLAANYSVKMTQGQPLQDRQVWNVTLTASTGHEWHEVP